MRSIVLLAALSLGCHNDKTDDTGVIVHDGDPTDDTGATDDTGTDQPIDADGDGVTADTDCDDDDPDTYPWASERCDGVDNDCDGDIDEDVLQTWYADADGDG